jgi:hypothetical protein
MTADTRASASGADPRAFVLLKSRRRLDLLDPDSHAWAADGQRACAVCGAPVPFGFGIRLFHNRAGRWACFDHRDTVQALTETTT